LALRRASRHNISFPKLGSDVHSWKTATPMNRYNRCNSNQSVKEPCPGTSSTTVSISKSTHSYKSIIISVQIEDVCNDESCQHVQSYDGRSCFGGHGRALVAHSMHTPSTPRTGNSRADFCVLFFFPNKDGRMCCPALTQSNLRILVVFRCIAIILCVPRGVWGLLALKLCKASDFLNQYGAWWSEIKYSSPSMPQTTLSPLLAKVALQTAYFIASNASTSPYQPNQDRRIPKKRGCL